MIRQRIMGRLYRYRMNGVIRRRNSLRTETPGGKDGSQVHAINDLVIVDVTNNATSDLVPIGKHGSKVRATNDIVPIHISDTFRGGFSAIQCAEAECVDTSLDHRSGVSV